MRGTVLLAHLVCISRIFHGNGRRMQSVKSLGENIAPSDRTSLLSRDHHQSRSETATTTGHLATALMALTRAEQSFRGVVAPTRAVRALPRVAIVGRPNVGKSTIFNALIEDRADRSVVFDKWGVTRDSREGRVTWWGNQALTLCDTGGLLLSDAPGEIFADHIKRNVLDELANADFIIMVADGQEGPTHADLDIAQLLRKQEKPVLLVVNKCEAEFFCPSKRQLSCQFHSLKLGAPFPASGIHRFGFAEILEKLASFPVPSKLQSQSATLGDNGAFRETGSTSEEMTIAIIGRPNSGKSTLMNRLTGINRSIVSDYAGTTVDAIKQEIIHGNRKLTFIDSAGVRKSAMRRATKRPFRSRKNDMEDFMVKTALETLPRADVIILLIDAVEGIELQEKRLASAIESSGAACILAVNKFDLVCPGSQKLLKQWEDYVESSLHYVAWAKPLCISAKTGKRAHAVFKAIDAVVKQYSRRIGLAVLNEKVEYIYKARSPPLVRGDKKGVIYYSAQISTKPPNILIVCNDPLLFPRSYKDYVHNELRDIFGFEGTPLRVTWAAEADVPRYQQKAKNEGYHPR